MSSFIIYIWHMESLYYELLSAAGWCFWPILFDQIKNDAFTYSLSAIYRVTYIVLYLIDYNNN